MLKLTRKRAKFRNLLQWNFVFPKKKREEDDEDREKHLALTAIFRQFTKYENVDSLVKFEQRFECQSAGMYILYSATSLCFMAVHTPFLLVWWMFVVLFYRKIDLDGWNHKVEWKYGIGWGTLSNTRETVGRTWKSRNYSLRNGRSMMGFVCWNSWLAVALFDSLINGARSKLVYGSFENSFEFCTFSFTHTYLF
jgi:hypothetical protein